MAASGTESCEFAPAYFPVSFSGEPLNDQISVAIENCQLCGGSKRCFYCVSCLKKGDFIVSRQKQNAQQKKNGLESPISTESYKAKMDEWMKQKQIRDKLYARSRATSEQILALEEKKNQIQLARQKNELLRQTVSDTREKLKQEKEKLQKLSEENRQRKVKSSRHVEKKKRILQYTQKSQSHTSNSLSSLDSTNMDLVKVRREQACDLVRYIFPITQVQPNAAESESHEESTIGLLAEARLTSYVKGRWVYTDNGGDHHYKIVHPAIPGNGDYSAYPVWLLSNKDVLSGPIESTLQMVNPAFNIGAALQYTAQVVNVLAFLLDVNLPYRLGYGDFGKDLEEERFYKLVFRLNSNVLQLSFSQSVDPDTLQAHHTIHNILTLLSSQHLGRTGPFQVPAELMASFEESHYALADDEEEISENDDVMDGADIEWEQVPSTLPEAEIPQSFYSSTQISRRTSESQLGAAGGSSGSLTGGLMSSAAAIGSSLWRYTWQSKTERK